MNVDIRQDILAKSLQRGASAALSDTAQGDTSNLANLIKSVKITASKDKLVFESATSLTGVKYTIPVLDDPKCGVVVKEEGAVLILAKELSGWVDKQQNCAIRIELKKLDAPEILSSATDGDGDQPKNSIRKIGNVVIKSTDKSKTGNKWAIDCYDPEQASLVDFTQKGNVLFEIPSEQLQDAIKSIAFSAQPKHYEHIYDSVMLEALNNALYMSTCDMTRCAVYKADKASNVSAGILDGSVRVLVPCEFISSFSKLAEENQSVEVCYDSDKNKVFVTQGGFECRVTIADKALFAKFPPVKVLVNKNFAKLCAIDKDTLQSRLMTVAMVNKSTALFKFKDNMVQIKAISETGVAPSVSYAPATDLNSEVSAVLAISHIMDVMKVVKDPSLTLYIPDNKKSFKVVSDVDPNFSYYAMTVENSKYDVSD